MKPKTKIQREAAARSAALPPVTDEQKEWCNRNLFFGYFTRSRQTLYCLECGHKWKDKAVLVSTLGGANCPECRKELRDVENYHAGANIYDYAAILTTCQGWQAVRMLHAGKFMKKHEPARYFVTEVMQHWISPEGQTVVMSKTTNAFGGYIDSWICSSDLEVRPHKYDAHPRYTLTPAKILPGRKVLPVIRRNGFNGHFYGLSPVRVFDKLLNDSRCETLLKAGQTALFREFALDKAVKVYWPSVRVCIRNGYVVKNVDTWRDYLKLLNIFGRDLLNPKYVCPADLKAEHDRLVARRQAQLERERREHLRKQIAEDNEKYQQAKGRFFGLKFQVEQAPQIEIVPLKSVQEVYEEGRQLKHCVFTNSYHNKPNSLLLSARMEGKPLETIEVDLKDMEVRQVRGLHNKPTEYNALIHYAVRQNLKQIAALKRRNPKTVHV